MIDWLTLIFAAVAAVGSVVRVYQNFHFHCWHKKQAKKADEEIALIPARPVRGTRAPSPPPHAWWTPPLGARARSPW
jgi:hypothetical protein